MLSSLPDLPGWLSLPRAAQAAVLEQVAAELRLPHPVSLSLDGYVLPRALLAHPRLAQPLAFRLLPAQRIPVGLSDANLAAIRSISDEPQISVEEMTPLRPADVGPLLVAELPLTIRAEQALLGTRSGDNAAFPAYLGESAALAAMQVLGADLPSEAEWEAAAKAGGDSLFPFGDSLPPEAQLEAWMNFDLDDAAQARTRFGIGGLFFAEWCGDRFAESHAPDAPRHEDARTIKGGGAYFWPWQDEEWVWCLCSMRMPSTDLDAGVAVARPVIRL